MGPHPYPVIVRDFQSVIGQEIKMQMEQLSNRCEHPDAVVACVGGGSNAIGTFYPFVDDSDVSLYGVEGAGKGIKSGKHSATLGDGFARNNTRDVYIPFARPVRTSVGYT